MNAVPAPGGEVVELEIPARADYLAVARMVVVAAAAVDGDFEENRLDDLRLAVSEACTNAIEAHAGIGIEDRIRIRCDLADGRIEVQVEDRGPGFGPGDLVELPDPSDPLRLEFEHGLGVTLMSALTDETEIESSPSRTRVRLTLYAGVRRSD